MKYFSILFLMLTGIFSQAQTTEYNPNIGWNYVKSQDLELEDGLWYNTEFAAEKEFSYRFIMNHRLDSAKASIQVFNLQDVNIGTSNSDTSMQVLDLFFEVTESGVYRVFFGLNDKKDPIDKHPVTFMLLRKKKI